MVTPVNLAENLYVLLRAQINNDFYEPPITGIGVRLTLSAMRGVRSPLPLSKLGLNFVILGILDEDELDTIMLCTYCGGCEAAGMMNMGERPAAGAADAGGAEGGPPACKMIRSNPEPYTPPVIRVIR